MEETVRKIEVLKIGEIWRH